MWVLQLVTDGGSTETETTHHECRNCGENLSPDAEECSTCGGEVAVYTLCWLGEPAAKESEILLSDDQ